MGESVSIGEFKTFILRKPDPPQRSNMAVDGTTEPVEFSFTIPEGFNFECHRMMVSIIDNMPVDASLFGGRQRLNNGVEYYFKHKGTSYDVLDGIKLKRNGDFSIFAGPDVAEMAGGKGIAVRWTFSRATGGRCILVPSGFSLNGLVHDDLTSLTRFRTSVQGVLKGI